MKINTIKNKDPFGTANTVHTKSINRKTTPKKVVEKMPGKPSDKSSDKPREERSQNPKANLRNWSVMIKLLYAEMPTKAPTVSGMMLQVGDDRYYAEFDQVSVFKKDDYSYRISVHGLKASESAIKISSQPGLWAATANKIILYFEDADVLPVRMTEFSVATKKSSGWAQAETMRRVKFVNNTSNTSQRETNVV